MKKFWIILGIVLLLTAATTYWLAVSQQDISPISLTAGSKIDEFNSVAVYSNGINYASSNGKHFSDDGYYYGQKWQCVEFIKRYYFLHFNHKMPNVYGHAKDFFQEEIKNGGFNADRALYQYTNGSGNLPQPGDILVWSGRYGHVAIVASVRNDEVEVVQQNIFGRPRQKITISKESGKYKVGDNSLLGWLTRHKP